MVSIENLKDLREKTGASITDVKKALEEASGDFVKALKIIQQKLGNVAEKKLSRDTRSGLIDSYIHSNGRVGTIIEVFCETDFVARNEEFKELVHDLAMHITAMNPLYLSLDKVPEEIWNLEKKRFEEEAKALGKPENITKEIVDGKLKSYFGAISFLDQYFVKDEDRKIKEIVNEAIGKFGENIKIGRFARLEL